MGGRHLTEAPNSEFLPYEWEHWILLLQLLLENALVAWHQALSMLLRRVTHQRPQVYQVHSEDWMEPMPLALVAHQVF